MPVSGTDSLRKCQFPGQNLKLLASFRDKLIKEELTSYRKEKGFEFEDMLYNAIDVSKSVRENIVNLRDSGWSFDDKLIYRLHKEKLNNTPINNT